LRNTIDAQRGYMMDDSGPIFPSDGFSNPLHTKIRSSWNVDSIFSELPPGVPDHRRLRALNTPPRRHLPRGPPEHRVLPARLQLLALLVRELLRGQRQGRHPLYWAADTELLVDLYETRDNLGYYLPYWRALNDSHCVSIASYGDTDIEELGMNLGDYIDELFNDDVPIGRYMESVQPDEDDSTDGNQDIKTCA
jgi:hypothetical protein